MLRLNPNHPSALSGLAVALTDKGDYRAALALNQNPKASEEGRAGLKRLGVEP